MEEKKSQPPSFMAYEMLNERMKIIELTSPFDFFCFYLKIVSILKHGHLDCCHPDSAENILTLNWIYLKGNDVTNSMLFARCI